MRGAAAAAEGTNSAPSRAVAIESELVDVIARHVLQLIEQPAAALAPSHVTRVCSRVHRLRRALLTTQRDVRRVAGVRAAGRLVELSPPPMPGALSTVSLGLVSSSRTRVRKLLV